MNDIQIDAFQNLLHFHSDMKTLVCEQLAESGDMCEYAVYVHGMMHFGYFIIP